MLSGETAVGAYPVEAVKPMVKIALAAEADIKNIRGFTRQNPVATDVTNAISHATVTSAQDLNASAIITVTLSGSTPRTLSRYRPRSVIVGCTSVPRVWRQMSLSWGTVPLMIGKESNTDDLFEHAVEAAVKVWEAPQFPSAGYELDEGMHGPNYGYNHNHAVILLNNGGRDEEKLLKLARYMKNEHKNGYIIGRKRLYFFKSVRKHRFYKLVPLFRLRFFRSGNVYEQNNLVSRVRFKIPKLNTRQKGNGK